MMPPFFLRIALPTPLRRLFDYLPPQDVDIKAIIVGSRVSVSFQSRQLVGIIVEISTKSDLPLDKLKRVDALLDSEPLLPPDLFELCKWAAQYYHASLGEVLASAMPLPLRQAKPLIIKPRKKKQLKRDDTFIKDELPKLNSFQEKAVQTIIGAQHTFQPYLLDGVTGSGKTEVYLRTIDAYLKLDQQILVLIPEISLTPQTIARFQKRFDIEIGALHSGLTESSRFQTWLQARSGEIKIIIGTRSAIFTPFAKLGLIIVDEEHDGSFKQQDRFRYHARDLAIMRARMNHIPIVLGSATPSFESLLNVDLNRYHRLSLPERAGNAILPQFEIINCRQTKAEEGLSPALLKAMTTHLDNNHQVMLFLNRRGFAPVLYCSNCTHMIHCNRCDAKLVYHRTPPTLHCHHCGMKRSLPKQCPDCGDVNLHPVGLGTQRIEEVLKHHFPNIPIIRIDRDTTRKKNSLQELLNEIHTQPKAILLGTQMIAKGHHFSGVTLVGLIDADSGLFSADFRAAEQLGQLILQVAGRAGRADQPGTVMIQTHHPDHPLLQWLIHEGYGTYAKHLLEERKQTNLPPFSYFALLRAQAYEKENAKGFLEKVKMITIPNSSVHLFGPTQAIISKRKNLHTEHLLIKANKRSELQFFITHLLQYIESFSEKSKIKWSIDIDPIEV